MAVDTPGGPDVEMTVAIVALSGQAGDRKPDPEVFEVLDSNPSPGNDQVKKDTTAA